uniref:Uncharacterized protein n=1 Tax=Panagrellus redivivus TaxID=6233 RepID=A0A7E4ZSR3_PANRE
MACGPCSCHLTIPTVLDCGTPGETLLPSQTDLSALNNDSSELGSIHEGVAEPVDPSVPPLAENGLIEDFHAPRLVVGQTQ